MDKIKKLRGRIAAFFTVFLAGFFMNAQTGIHFPEYNSVDSVINAFMQDRKISGGSVALVKNGRLIYSKGFGYSDFERTQPTEPNSLFRIASISKPVTAIAIMKLIEDGYFSLSTKVFGEGALINDAYYLGAINDKRIYDITVRHLLEHTAGWDRNVPYGPFGHCDPAFFPLYVTILESEPNPVGDSTLIRFKLGKGLHFSPGRSYSYSNVGYLVLGKIIERVTGMSYEAYVKKTILEPAGVHDMHLGRNLRADKFDREVDYVSDILTQSCYGDGSLVPPQYGGFNLEAMNAHGGWVASAPDLARLLVSLEKGNVLKEESKQNMLAPGLLNPGYASGWQVNYKGNYWHTGSLDGTSAFAATTRDGYSWVFLFNGRSDNSMEFWRALDQLPRAALKMMKRVPSVDLFGPTRNSGILAARAISPGTISLRWVNGDGDGRIVVASTSSQAVFPLQGTNYYADPEFGLGSQIGEDAFVVYDGNGSNTTVTNLDPSLTYHFTVYEYRRNKNTGQLSVYKPGAARTVAQEAETWAKM